MVTSGGVASPPAEEAALAHLEVGQLREAIGTLASEERQALSLYYFEERSGRESARLLGCSERTFRRRLDSALEQLRRRFGIAVPGPESELAIGVGLAAWASLGGARVPAVQGPLDHLLAAVDSLRRLSSGLGGRARELVARMAAGSSGEGIAAAASGPLGKATGACAGALVACALTGVLGPGVGGVDLVGGGHASLPPVPKKAHSSPLGGEASSASTPSPNPSPRGEPASGSTTPTHASSSLSSRALGAKQSERAIHEATSQFGVESSAPQATEAAPPPEPNEPSAAPVPPSNSKPSPTEAANAQFAP
jgi:hypothetical protein